MSVLALLVQTHETAGAEVDSIARTFGVSWSHLTAQMISFGIVCAILYRLAYKPVLRMLEERRTQIAQGLENTAKINAALAEIDAKRQQTIAQAQAQGAQLVAEAREVARRLHLQETQRAAAAAEQIIAAAREAANQEHARMLADLKREVGRLVTQTTAAVIGKVLTADDQRRLAEDSAKQLSVH